MTTPTVILDEGNPDPCADCGNPLGVEYISSAGERSHTLDGSCTQPGWKPAPTACFACAGPLDTDGTNVWCADGCQDPDDDEDDDLPDHRHNSAPHCAKCGGACEMPKDI